MDSFINKYNILLSVIGMDEIKCLMRYIIVDIDVNQKDIDKLTEKVFYEYCSCCDISTVIHGLYLIREKESYRFKQIFEKVFRGGVNDVVEASTNNVSTFVYRKDIISLIKDVIELYDEHSIGKETLDRILIVLNQMYQSVITDKDFDVYNYFGCFFHEMSLYIKDEISKFLLVREIKIYTKGEIVTLEKCEYYSPFCGVIEFCVDGKWGLMDTNNVVILENLYDSRFSDLSQIDVNNEKYVILSIGKPSKKGVLSLNTFSYIIDADYDEVFPLKRYGRLYFEVNIGGKHDFSYFVDEFLGGFYGLFLSNGQELIPCEYTSLEFRDDYIECDNKLFDKDGKLIIGGYSSLSIEAGYLKIYFNLYDKRYEDSFCLVIDSTFYSLMPHDGKKIKLQPGTIYCSLQEVFDVYPKDVLLRSEVDLSYIENGFIILRNPNVEYHISELLEYDDIKKEYLTDLNGYGVIFPPFNFDVFCKYRYGYIPKHSHEKEENQFPKYVDSVWKDNYIHQKEAIIIKVDQNNQNVWSIRVDDVYSFTSNYILYLKNEKIGIIVNDTIYEPTFSGAALNSNYVAVVKKGDTKDGTYYKEQDETIQFLEVEYNNSILIKHVSDSFYPYELNWFPIGFRNKYGLFVENVKDDNESGFFMNEENSYVNDYIDSPEDAIMRSLSGHGCDPELFGF